MTPTRRTSALASAASAEKIGALVSSAPDANTHKAGKKSLMALNSEWPRLPRRTRWLGLLAHTFNQLEPLLLRRVVETHFGRALGKLHGVQDTSIQVGANMIMQGLLGFPLFAISDVVMGILFFGKPTTDTTL